MGPVSWGLLFAGAVAIPLLITGVGTILVFQKAERVEFCASCHLTMKSFVDDMQESHRATAWRRCITGTATSPTTSVIAAIRRTAYSVPWKRKKKGLNDVYKYYTRTFHLPIKLRHPYPNHDCLKCHAGSAKWIASHEDYKDALFSGQATCMQCHADSNPAHNIAQNCDAMNERPCHSKPCEDLNSTCYTGTLLIARSSACPDCFYPGPRIPLKSTTGGTLFLFSTIAPVLAMLATIAAYLASPPIDSCGATVCLRSRISDRDK